MQATATDTAATIARGFAIKTKFLGPTNYKGSRVSASYKRSNDETLRATVEWRHELSAEQNHCRAAQTLINKANEDGRAYYREIGIGAEFVPFEMTAIGWDQENYFFFAGKP